VLGAPTISKSERVEELEKMADEVAKKNRDLSGDPPKVELDEMVNGNLNETLPGPPVPSGKSRDKRRMGWDEDLASTQEVEHHDLASAGRRDEGRFDVHVPS
jgi:hypothetical protein